MLETLPQTKGANIAVRESGLVSKADYDAYLPEFQRQVEQVLQFRLLLDWEDLEGWEEEAIPIRFVQTIMHRLRCERLAIVSDDPERLDDIKNLEGLTMIRDFRVFPPGQRAEAWAWLTE